jgi:hypothetical protein
MKKIFILTFFFVFYFSITFAQKEKESIVYLKNGYSVKGVIVERTDKIIKIKTTDLQIFEYSPDEIDRISSDSKKARTSGDNITPITPNTVFNKGDQVLNIGLGIGNKLYSGNYYQSKFPPVSAYYEFCVKDELFNASSSFGVGGFLGITGAKSGYTNNTWRYTSFILGPRAAIHYQFLEKFDTYGGLMLGYNIVSTKWTGEGEGGNNTASVSGFAWSLFVGGRYYLSDKLAALVELGYGISYVNVGIALKL